MLDRRTEERFAREELHAPHSRRVAGYLRAYRRYRHVQDRLDAKLAALDTLRSQVAQRKDQATIRAHRLTGGEHAAVLRILKDENHLRMQGQTGGPGL
mgnify:FL=1